MDLTKLVSYENPNSAEHTRLTQEHESVRDRVLHDPRAKRAIATPYVFELKRVLSSKPAVVDFLSNKLGSGLLIDLGCGSGWKIMAQFAQELGVKTYIGIDALLLDAPDMPIREKQGFDKTEVYLAKADMLSFLSKLQPSSANFVLNGIDKAILHPPNYERAVLKELCRATKIGGIVFGVETVDPFEMSFACDIDYPLALRPEYSEEGIVEFTVLEKQDWTK